MEAPTLPNDLSTLKVADLQAALAARGLPRSGRKAELVERLEAALAASGTAETRNGGSDGGGGSGGSDQADAESVGAAAASRRRRAAPADDVQSAAVAPAAAARAAGVDGGETPAAGVAAVRRARPRADGAATAAAVTRRRASADGGDEASGSGGGGGGSASGREAEGEAEAAPRARRLSARGPPADEGAEERPVWLLDPRSATPPSARSSAAAVGKAGPSPPAPAPPATEAQPSAEASASPRRGVRSAAAAPSMPEADAGSRMGRREAAAASAQAEAEAETALDYDPALGPRPDLDNLPPWPKLCLGRPQRATDLAPNDPDAQFDLLSANAAGLTISSLGSAAVRASATRGLGALALARGKDIFIFDAGDDTQRQVGRLPHVRPSKVYRVFLTSLEPECVLGLPGLMCTINASRERGHEASDIPVHVYGPPGTADFLATMMRLSQTCLEITIIVYEISMHAVPEEHAEPTLYASKSKVWRVLMPPDQLNPGGGVDASLLSFAPSQGRGQKKKGRNAGGGVLGFDPRAGYQPWPPLQPGDPTRRGLTPLEMRWTLELDISGRVMISLLPGPDGGHTLAYTVQEADRTGSLVMDRVTAAGVEPGAALGKLKDFGETVTNRWGQSIAPSLVVTPRRPGRKVVLLGATRDPGALAAQPHAAGADVLVAGAVWPQDEAAAAAQGGGCTSEALGRVAQQLGVRYLLLSRFDGRRLEQLDAAAAAAAAAAGAAEQRGNGGKGVQGGAGGGRDGSVKEYTGRIAAEVLAAAKAAAAAEPGAKAGKGGRASKARGGGSDGGGRGSGTSGSVSGCRLRGVMVVDDLESVLVERNEGPAEREDD